MANVITDPSQRTHPLRRPDNYKPKLPRWTLTLPQNFRELSVVYIGIQPHHETVNISPATESIEHLLQNSKNAPLVIDRFSVLSGHDQVGSRIWCCYWIHETDSSIQNDLDLDLNSIYSDLNEDYRKSIGLWTETFKVDFRRFETNYSGDDYRPGLAGAALEGMDLVSHGLTGYWGAARDRIYDSAFDDLGGAHSGTSSGGDGLTSRSSIGMHLKGTNQKIIAHIRSGQFWENCSTEEKKAYEDGLEPYLRKGLDDIKNRPGDLGDYGLRFLRNCCIREGTIDEGTAKPGYRRETCAAGFFRSLADLEAWAKDCPSHHKIYGGSVHHRTRFGKSAKMRTWHEICVLKPGEASWEYLNCLPDTGTLSFQGSEST